MQTFTFDVNVPNVTWADDCKWIVLNVSAPHILWCLLRHSPVHGLFDLLLPELDELRSLHAGRNGGEAARSDQPAVKTTREQTSVSPHVSNKPETEPERNSTCLRVWRSPFHLVSPPRSPPPPLPQRTLHQTPPARPTWLDLLPPPPLWPVNIIRQTESTAAGMRSVWRRNNMNCAVLQLDLLTMTNLTLHQTFPLFLNVFPSSQGHDINNLKHTNLDLIWLI